MKVGIIGLGVVGKACKFGFEKLGHDVSYHDIALGTTIREVYDTTIVFICVPTPSKETGQCDSSIVEECVKDLWNLGYTGHVVIKSTVEPGTTERLHDEYGNVYQLKSISFVPEFLRERCAIADFVENHDLLAIGTFSQDAYEAIVKVHGNYPKAVVRLNPTQAELLKYYSNALNATKVIFANAMANICDSVGVEYTVVKNAYLLRGGMIDAYLDVNNNFRGYGGQCLPKDVKELAYLENSKKLNTKFFTLIDKENNKLKKTVFEGMRK